MARLLLNLQDIHLTFGGKPVLEGVSLMLSEGERIALVGRNGTGKSTLLKIVAGMIEQDSGERFFQPGTTVRYLPQEPDFAGFATVLAYVEAGLGPTDNPYRAQMLLNELGLTGEQQRAEFASSMNQDVTYFRVKVRDFKELMQESFPLAQSVMLYLGERLRKAERQWESLILKDVRTRIVEFLKESAGERGRQVGYETLVKHGLTQQDIANLVGASRQTVTAILNELRKSNLIHFNRNSILIRDMDKLN